MKQTIKKRVKRYIKRNYKGHYDQYNGYFQTKIVDQEFILDYDNVNFWLSAANNKWEPETFTILSEFLTPDSFYCDIGAWIGPTVVYAAKKCKKVICFEPDPIAFNYLLKNIKLNNLFDKVSPYNVAISDQNSILKMSSFGGSMGDSMTSLLPSDKKTSEGFDAIVLNWSFIEKMFNLDKIDFLKIDIEGGEFSLIPVMADFLKKHKPPVWLSLHAPLLPEDQRVEKLQGIIDVMSCYKTCLDSNLQPVNMNALLSDESVNKFPAFLFKD